jgi:serine/threonine-protein kinase
MSAVPVPVAESGPKAIGAFELRERLGKGAMGVVYRALDRRSNRLVALKVVAADLEGDVETRSRFFREADVVAGLSHRNLVKVFESGDEGGRLFIAMELLNGRTLTQVMKEDGRLETETQFDLFTQVLHGLIAAHERGVCHRDIKPANLFVCDDGRVKILDFGVARLAGSNMTLTGYILGTPDFMSPEQARGEDVDGRSDVFSAGAAFYYVVTGRKPFAAPDLPAVLHNVMNTDPVPIRDDEAPPALGAAIMQALAKDPARRPQNAARFVLDLATAWRSYAAETRTRASAVVAADRAMRAREARVQARREELGVAGAPLDSWAEIAPEHRVFSRGEDALEVFPLRRRVIEQAARAVAEATAQVDRMLSPLEAAAASVAAARAFLAQEDAETAQHHLDAALVAAPGSETAQQLHAEAANLLARQRAQAALRLSALDAERAAKELELEAAKRAQKEREAARIDEQARAEAAARLTGLIESARAHLVRGRFEKATLALQQALAQDPNYEPAHVLLAETAAAQQAAEAQAEQERAEARRLRAALPALREARRAFEGGDLVRARSAAENALALAPNHPEATELLERMANLLVEDDDDTVDVSVQEDDEDTARIGVTPPGVMGALERVTHWWRQMRSDRGQTTTEYLMIAAVLTAVGMLLAKILPPVLLIYFQGIAVSISSKGI